MTSFNPEDQPGEIDPVTGNPSTDPNYRRQYINQGVSEVDRRGTNWLDNQSRIYNAQDRNNPQQRVYGSWNPSATNTNAYNINSWDQMWKDASAARGTPDLQNTQWGDVINPSEYAGQNQLWADELQRRAMGQGGPSVAEQQLQAGMDTQARQAMSLAASQRGVSPGMAMRQAQQAQGQMAAQTNQQSGILRAQEQQAAGQAYQQAIATGLSQEQAWNQAQLAQQGMRNQQEQAWNQTQLGQQQINDSWSQFGMTGQQAEKRYNQLAQLETDAMNRGDQRMLAQIALERERLQAQMDQAGQARSDNMWGGLLNTAGQLGAAYLTSGG